MSQQDENIVIDRAKSSWSDLWKKEDYWAIWIGVAIVLFTIALIVPSKSEFIQKIQAQNEIIAAEKAKPYETIALIEAKSAKKAITGGSLPAMKEFKTYFATPKKWSGNIIQSMVLTQDQADAANANLLPKIDAAKEAATLAKEVAVTADNLAKDANYQDQQLNADAEKAITAWQEAKNNLSKLEEKIVKPYNLLPKMIMLGCAIALLMSIGIFFMGSSVAKFIAGFIGVYFLCVVAQILGVHKGMSYYGINAEIWSIVLGMLVANTIKTPQWIMPAVQVEYYIKTGLVLLGGEVLFTKIVAIGIPGIFVAWVVTPIVLISTFIFGQKVLKMESKTLNITISADMSVCGTSAAIATAAACRAKKEELTLAVGLSLTFTAIMMIALPAAIKAIGLDAVLGGAWIGGTIDSTGAVAAAGAFLGDTAMQVAATIKMIQNVLIGVTAFFVAIYFTTKVEHTSDGKVSLMEIWHRFPKFVIGFLGVSILLSTMAASYGSDLSYTIIDKGIVDVTKGLRGWYFALAFISVGLATNFRELASYFKGGKPLILYVCGQSFNLALTLFMAWVMFDLAFPEIKASILAQ